MILFEFFLNSLAENYVLSLGLNDTL